jgi:hypothetical protein
VNVDEGTEREDRGEVRDLGRDCQHIGIACDSRGDRIGGSGRCCLVRGGGRSRVEVFANCDTFRIRSCPRYGHALAWEARYTKKTCYDIVSSTEFCALLPKQRRTWIIPKIRR